jgi:predicted ATPase
MLRGRRAECQQIDQLIEAVRAGKSRALVIRGEDGVGKCALLEYLAAEASGCRVVRVAGVQAEAAAARPLVCVIDDAHRLDRTSAQTLAFVARRLGAESLALVFALRDPADDQSRRPASAGPRRPALR